MEWIFLMAGSTAAILGLLAMTTRAPRLRFPRLRPTVLLRGCLALTCLVAAMACAGMAMLVAPW